MAASIPSRSAICRERDALGDPVFECGADCEEELGLRSGIIIDPGDVK
jgi:hypothetical protein